MPEVTDQPAKPRRIWLPMALWTAGILLVMVLSWAATFLLVARSQVRAAAGRYVEAGERMQQMGRGHVSWVSLSHTAEYEVRELGGPERAVSKCALYLRLPPSWAPDRLAAVTLLGNCGSSAVPALTSLLEDRRCEPDIRGAAACYLGLAKDPRAFAPLAAALHDHEPGVRSASAQALGTIGPAAGQAVPALEEALKDRDEFVRRAATFALKQIRAEEPPK